MPVSLFFRNIGPNLIWHKFCPYNHNHYLFFCWFSIMLQDPININNFCCNPEVLKKKIGKTSTKIAFSGPICTTKGSAWAMSKMKKQFFSAEITTVDHWLSETFYFIKTSYVLPELWVFFYLFDVFFDQKRIISS